MTISRLFCNPIRIIIMIGVAIFMFNSASGWAEKENEDIHKDFLANYFLAIESGGKVEKEFLEHFYRDSILKAGIAVIGDGFFVRGTEGGPYYLLAKNVHYEIQAEKTLYYFCKKDLGYFIYHVKSLDDFKEYFCLDGQYVFLNNDVVYYWIVTEKTKGKGMYRYKLYKGH